MSATPPEPSSSSSPAASDASSLPSAVASDAPSTASAVASDAPVMPTVGAKGDGPAPETLSADASLAGTRDLDPRQPQATTPVSQPAGAGGAGLSPLLGIAAFAGIVVVLKLGQELILPLLVAAFISMLLAPMVRGLVERGVPRALAVPLVLLGLLLVFGALGALIGSSIGDFTERVPFYRARVNDLTLSLFTWLNQIGIPVNAKSALGQINPGVLFGAFGQALSAMASAFSTAMLVLLLVVFMLFEAEILPDKLRVAFGDVQRQLGGVREATQKVQRYLWVKTLVSLGTGIGVALTLWLAGVDFPVLWGVCAFLLNYVPNIGSLIAAVPPILLGLVQGGAGLMAVVAGCVLGVNFVFGNVIEPRMLGRQLGLSTLVVFLALFVFGYIWGVTGMLLSTPLVVVVQIVCAASPRHRWIAVLLGAEPDAWEGRSDDPATPPSSAA